MPDQPPAKPAGKDRQRFLVIGLAVAGGAVVYLLWKNYTGGGGGSAGTTAGSGAGPGTDMGSVIQTVQGPPGKTGRRGPRGPRGPAGDDDRKVKKATKEPVPRTRRPAAR